MYRAGTLTTRKGFDFSLEHGHSYGDTEQRNYGGPAEAGQVRDTG